MIHRAPATRASFSSVTRKGISNRKNLFRRFPRAPKEHSSHSLLLWGGADLEPSPFQPTRTFRLCPCTELLPGGFGQLFQAFLDEEFPSPWSHGVLGSHSQHIGLLFFFSKSAK